MGWTGGERVRFGKRIEQGRLGKNVGEKEGDTQGNWEIQQNLKTKMSLIDENKD